MVIALHRQRDDARAVGLALAGTSLIGASLFVRFSNISIWPVVMALPPLIVGRAAFRQRRMWASLIILGLAFIGLLIFNAVYYGGPLVTGYSPQHGWYAQPAFSVSYAFGKSFVDGNSVPAIARTLWGDMGGLILLAVIGLAAKPHRVSAWLMLAALALLAPYAIYAFAAQGVNSRFIIPALPALFLLAGKGLTALGARLAGRWQLVLGVTVAIGLLAALWPTLAGLRERNQTAQSTIARARELSNFTEPDAVVLSYAYNDLIAVYGQRSVLNYRHMVPWDQAAGRYVHELFETVLTAEITRLLSTGTPVYYILDRNPPLLDSFAILQRHFDLQPVSPDQPIYRVLSTTVKGTG